MTEQIEVHWETMARHGYGRSPAKSRWATVLRSAGGRYLAVISYTPHGRPSPPGPFPFIGNREPSAGVSHLEIFDGNTGARLAAGEHRYSSFSTSMLADEAFWLGSKWFIMPVDGLGQTVWIAAVEVRPPGP